MLDSLLGTPQAGGAWTAPDNQSHPLAFTPGVDSPGVYCYTVPGTAPCTNDTACLTISLLEPNDPACLGTAVSGTHDPTGSVIVPEPNNGHFRVMAAQGAIRLDVFDVHGRTVLSIPTTAISGNMEVDLPSTLSTGRYVLSVVSDSGTQRLPFTLVR